MAGNQFVVMDLLVAEFKKQNPDVKNIFYVTIPPGQLLNWILADAIELKTSHSLIPEGFRLRVKPDVYTTVSKQDMDALFSAGLITRYYTYAHNRLVYMVRADDPLAGRTLTPLELYSLLSDPTLKISEPNILTQGIERQFWQMYVDLSKAVYPNDTAVQAMNPTMFNPAQLSQDPLNSIRRIVYYDKVNNGSTLVNHIHHIETPVWLRQGIARIGPVWATEALYQVKRLGETDLGSFEIGGNGLDGKPLNRSTKVNYLATIVEGKMDRDHKKAAKKWIEFLRTPAAQAIFTEGGFIPGTPAELATPYLYPNGGQFNRVGSY
jgi:ABC-type molybdate transport system substrate-binding protein